MIDHPDKLANDILVGGIKIARHGFLQVPTMNGKLDPHLGFRRFAFSLAKLIDERSARSAGAARLLRYTNRLSGKNDGSGR
jgi:hypothetical protein